MDTGNALIELLLFGMRLDLFGMGGPDLFQLRAAADIGPDKILTDRFIGSPQRQQDEHGRHAGAVFPARAVEQDRRFTRLQRPEQLLVGLIAEEHLLIHGIGEVTFLVLLALEQLFNVPGREGDLASVRVAKPADTHQPRAIGHIVGLLRCL